MKEWGEGLRGLWGYSLMRQDYGDICFRVIGFRA